MKLWQKNTDANQAVDKFTVGRDREMDIYLAEADVLGSLAHTRMLNSIGLLNDKDLEAVQRELKNIHAEIVAGRFKIEDGVEDVHSQVEFMLTERIGDAGKKIHSGRSRNDQVLVDLRIFLRRQIWEIVEDIDHLFRLLQTLSEKYKEAVSYTHLDVYKRQLLLQAVTAHKRTVSQYRSGNAQNQSRHNHQKKCHTPISLSAEKRSIPYYKNSVFCRFYVPLSELVNFAAAATQ